MTITSNQHSILKDKLQIVTPTEVKQRMAKGDTFVVNVVTAWCPDCTERQQPYMQDFVEALTAHHIEVLQLNVQLSKGDFITAEHQQLTQQFGGPGYPRTVLIKQGEIVDQNNVEVITYNALIELSQHFIKISAQA